MSIQDWGAVGEIFGAVGVIITLIYLAIQIRESTRTARLAATRELFAVSQVAVSSISANEVITEVWLIGLRDRDRLNYRDRFRFNQICYRMIAAFEQQYLHLQENSINAKYFGSQIRSFEGLLAYRGFRDNWHANKNFYNEEFREHMENIIDATPELVPEEFEVEQIKISY
jgi:hypothetical protein